MSLPLETCRALAEKYAEVREHRYVSGDAVYYSETFAPDWHRHGRLGFVMWDQDREGIDTQHIWCPRLDDLLSVASSHATTVCQLVQASYGESDSPTPDGNWLFSASAWPDDVCGADTPEAAVAAWLLARQ